MHIVHLFKFSSYSFITNIDCAEKSDLWFKYDILTFAFDLHCTFLKNEFPVEVFIFTRQ